MAELVASRLAAAIRPPWATVMPLGLTSIIAWSALRDPAITEALLPVTRFNRLAWGMGWMIWTLSPAPMEKLFQLMMALVDLSVMVRLFPTEVKSTLPLITCGPVGRATAEETTQAAVDRRRTVRKVKARCFAKPIMPEAWQTTGRPVCEAVHIGEWNTPNVRCLLAITFHGGMVSDHRPKVETISCCFTVADDLSNGLSFNILMIRLRSFSRRAWRDPFEQSSP